MVVLALCAVAIEPDCGEAGVEGARDVRVQPVADVPGLRRLQGQASQRVFEDRRLRLAGVDVR